MRARKSRMRSKQQKVKSFNELTSRSLILAELRKVENEIGKIKSRTHQLREIKKQRSRPHAYVAPIEPVSKTVYNDPTLSRSAPLSTRPGDGWQNDGGWIEDVKTAFLSFYLFSKFRTFMRRNTRIRRAIILAKASLSKFDESAKSSRAKVSSCGNRHITMITTCVRCRKKKQLSKRSDVRSMRCG
jgi:hypothetical protein